MNMNKTETPLLSKKQALSTNIDIDKLQTVIMFLTTKYAQTKDVKFAEAAYQHLCMMNDHSDAGPELKFFCQSLIMDWRSIVCNQGLINIQHI